MSPNVCNGHRPSPLLLVGRDWGCGSLRGIGQHSPYPPASRLPSSHKGATARKVALVTTLLLAACQTTPPSRDYLQFVSAQDPATVASRMAERVGACWFGRDSSGFAGYSYAPELNSFSGKPRVLVVPKSDPGGLPKLIIEASAAERGTSVKLFGPLLAESEGARIAGDVERWAGGAAGCSA